MPYRRSSLVFGSLCSALAASIMAVKVPYYAIFAWFALMVLLVTWIVVLARAARRG